LIFQLADRWGEPDPRKIAQLPADIITHWQAFFSHEPNPEPEQGEHPPITQTPLPSSVEEQCNNVMRILNG
jgi:hypothetical protein